MNLNDQLKLQAYLDGELSEAEAKAVAKWLADDADASLLLRELKNTKQAVTRNELYREFPEAREFFWSKIEREIRRQEPAPPDAGRGLVLPWWKRWLMPAVTLACMALTLTIGIKQFTGGAGRQELETDLADVNSLTYRDDAAGVTLVWLSYPPESGIEESEEFDSIN